MKFSWIASLEKRFGWVVNNFSVNDSSSKYLLLEMIEWGGSQNGVLQKFNDYSVLLPYTIDLSIYADIDDPDVMAHIRRVGLVFYEQEECRIKPHGQTSPHEADHIRPDTEGG
jgi:hypothetical protein